MKLNETFSKSSKSIKADLSKIEGTMTYVLQNNVDSWKSLETVTELVNTIEKLFDDNGINTIASRKLIANLKIKRTAVDAIYYLFNSILKGSMLGVN